MCNEGNIPFIKHNETIPLDIYLNESKLHLNNHRNTALAKSITEFLSNFNWWCQDKSDNSDILHIQFQQILKAKGKDKLGDSVHESEINLSPDSEESSAFVGCEDTPSLHEQEQSNFQTVLKNIHLKNLNRIIFGHLNINSIK